MKKPMFIDKEKYPMVANWVNYKNKKTKIPCFCQKCGIVVQKTLKYIDKYKTCQCVPCSYIDRLKKLHTNENYKKRNETNLKKYGYTSPSKSNVVKNKSKKTCIEKYGYESSAQHPDIKTKQVKTLIERYGVTNPFQMEKVINHLKSKEMREKVYNTRKKNNSFNNSKIENNCYNILCEKYGINNVIRQYKDVRYPFACDFYIISTDTFIECNFHWTHGKEMFDKNNQNHKKTLSEWNDKNTKYYDIAILVWTNTDIKKTQIAKQNNLNYKVFYSIEEFNSCII